MARKKSSKSSESKITKEQYDQQLHGYVVEQMSNITDEVNGSIEFWANFNTICKQQFDSQLSESGISVG